jgi:hypothetical protein
VDRPVVENRDQGPGAFGGAVDGAELIEQGDKVGGALGRAGVHERVPRDQMLTNTADGELAFFATWCPAGTPVAVLVSVEGQRWPSRTASRRRKPSSASTTTRPAPGTAGIGTFCPSCRPSQCWPPSAARPTRPRPPKQPADDPQEPPLIRWPVQEICSSSHGPSGAGPIKPPPSSSP